MGASSSVQSSFIRSEIDPYIVMNECKEEGKYDDDEYEKYVYSTYSIHTSYYGHEEDEKNDCNSPVWVAINSIIKTVLIIKTDFQNTHCNVLFEVMKKIMINIDSIYNIKHDTFNYGEIQPIDNTKLKIVKKLLINYYGNESLVVIKLEDHDQKIADLGKFIYDLLVFQIENSCVYVYAAL